VVRGTFVVVFIAAVESVITSVVRGTITSAIKI
jgi:hypothetical protein